MTTEDVREQAEGLAASEEEARAHRHVRHRRRRAPADDPCPSLSGTVLIAEDADAERGERIRELVKIVQESGVGEIEIEDEGMRVSVRRADEPAPLTGASVAPDGGLVIATRDEPPDHGVVRVESPMVGVFYRAPNPGAPAFVDIGDTVVPGQTLCVLEAMKLFNELKAETTGTVRAIHVENAAAGRVRSAAVRGRADPRASGRLGAGHVLARPRRESGRDRVRVIRALHELGVEAVAVYSTAIATLCTSSWRIRPSASARLRRLRATS